MTSSGPVLRPTVVHAMLAGGDRGSEVRVVTSDPALRGALGRRALRPLRATPTTLRVQVSGDEELAALFTNLNDAGAVFVSYDRTGPSPHDHWERLREAGLLLGEHRTAYTSAHGPIVVLEPSDLAVVGTVRNLLLRHHHRFSAVALDDERGRAYSIAIDRAAGVVFGRTFKVHPRSAAPPRRIDDPNLLQDICAELTRWLDRPMWQDDAGCDACDEISGRDLPDVATEVVPIRGDFQSLWRCGTCGMLFERSEWDRFQPASRLTASTARARFPGGVPLAEAVVEQLRVRGQLTRAAGELLVELGLLDERPAARAGGDPIRARRAVTRALLRDAAVTEPDERLPRRLTELRALLDDPDLPQTRQDLEPLLYEHPGPVDRGHRDHTDLPGLVRTAPSRGGGYRVSVIAHTPQVRHACRAAGGHRRPIAGPAWRIDVPDLRAMAAVFASLRDLGTVFMDGADTAPGGRIDLARQGGYLHGSFLSGRRDGRGRIHLRQV